MSRNESQYIIIAVMFHVLALSAYHIIHIVIIASRNPLRTDLVHNLIMLFIRYESTHKKFGSLISFSAYR